MPSPAVRRRRSASVLLTAALLVSAAWEALAEPLRIAIEGSYPPFSEVTPDGSMTGFDVDIARALCGVIRDGDCALVQTNWDQIIPSLHRGEVDMIVASLSISRWRAKGIAFSEPYYHSPAAFVGPVGLAFDPEADEPPLPDTPVLIGVQAGTTHARYLEDRKPTWARTVLFPSQVRANRALIEKEVTVVLGDALALEQGFLRHPDAEGYGFVGPALRDPDYFGTGMGIAVRESDPRLLASVNEALDTIRSSGLYDEIIARYFTYDIGVR